MTLPEPIFVGFFPKITQPGSDWLGNEVVKVICSVSTCISPGPEDWIQHWKHNDLGFYDSEEILQQVIATEKDRYDLFAYRLFPFRCLGGKIEAIEVQPSEGSLTRDYEFLGYDIVTKSIADFFECSPLSCNAAAKEYPVNRYCLIQDKQTALETLGKICREGAYEPGPYYLFEVYRKVIKDPKELDP